MKVTAAECGKLLGSRAASLDKQTITRESCLSFRNVASLTSVMPFGQCSFLAQSRVPKGKKKSSLLLEPYTL